MEVVNGQNLVTVHHSPHAESQLQQNESPDLPVIIPPSDIKKVIDHTAQSILAKPKLEELLLSKKADDPKFSFMFPHDKFYNYYRMKFKYPGEIPSFLVKGSAEPSALDIAKDTPYSDVAGAISSSQAQQILQTTEKVGGVSMVQAPPPPPPPPLQQPQQPKQLSLFDRMNAFVRKSTLPVPNPEDVENLTYPAPENFKTIHSVKLPSVYYAHELDVIKLCALNVASNGRRFLAGLQNREMNNPQFDFLKTTHPHHETFLQLTDSYKQIIAKPHSLVDDINRGLKDFSIVLDDLSLRSKYALAEAIRKEEREREGEEDDADFIQTIDWHNFVVCETITFSPDEDPYLAEPKHTIEEIEAALAMEQHLIQQAQDDAKASTEGDSAAAVKTLKKETFTGGAVAVEDDDEAIVLKKDRTTTLDEATTKSSVEDLVTPCPLCNTMVPVASLQEHIAIELANPDWKKQKQLQDEQRHAASLTAAAQGGATSVATNLARIISKRGDTTSYADAASDKPGKSWSQLMAMMRQEDLGEPQVKPQVTQPPASKPTKVLPVAGPSPQPSIASVSSRASAPISIRPLGDLGNAPLSSSVSSAVITPAISGLGLGQPVAGGARFGTTDFDSDLAKRGKTDTLITPPVSTVLAPAAQTGSGLMPEADWLAANEPEEGATIDISVPDMPESKEGKDYLFDGRTFQIPLTTLKETVAELKSRISTQLNNMPNNKMKLSVGGVFLNKDNFTLAYYNVKSRSSVEVGLRVRGGKK